MSQEVINQKELADFLGISRKTLRKFIENGEVPGRKIGTRYFFDRGIIRGWLAGEGTKEEVIELRGEIEGLKEEKKKLEGSLDDACEELKDLRGMFLCKVCGKPMYLDENLIKYVRGAIRNWGHSSCLEEEKKEKERQKEVNSG